MISRNMNREMNTQTVKMQCIKTVMSKITMTGKFIMSSTRFVCKQGPSLTFLCESYHSRQNPSPGETRCTGRVGGFSSMETGRLNVAEECLGLEI